MNKSKKLFARALYLVFALALVAGLTLVPAVAAATWETWVDDSWTCQDDVDAFKTGLTWDTDAFDTIQEGIDHIDVVGGGGRVNVRPGTYTETITMDKVGLTLESTDGAATTIIDANGLDPDGLPASLHCAAVMILAEGVTFGGTDKGFTVKDAGVGVSSGGVGEASTDWADENSDGIADVTGVYIWPTWGTDPEPQDTDFARVSVIGNTIYGSQAKGIRADGKPVTGGTLQVSVYIAENTVYDNLFEGFQGEKLGSDDAELDTIIEDNEFRNNGPSGAAWTDSGIQIDSTVSGDTVYILGNNIHDNDDAGIQLLVNATVGTLSIKQNTIHDNGSYGIYSEADTPGQITCEYNDIYGNTDWGINSSIADVTAKYNWWGAMGGPSVGTGASTALGNGDAVNNKVVYDPWLTKLQATVITDGIRWYGSDGSAAGNPGMTLQEGWNTLSVPLNLKDDADTFGQIAALGSFLDPLGPANYCYNATARLWKLIGDDTQLLPGMGFYVQMDEATRFPVLYNGEMGPMPSYDVYGGWNLVGSMFGVDGTWGVEEEAKSADDALTSLGTSATVLVSPSLPGQNPPAWAVTHAGFNGKNMYTGEAYWVFMTGAEGTVSGTLAGFEITPFCFVYGA